MNDDPLAQEIVEVLGIAYVFAGREPQVERTFAIAKSVVIEEKDFAEVGCTDHELRYVEQAGLALGEVLKHDVAAVRRLERDAVDAVDFLAADLAASVALQEPAIGMRATGARGRTRRGRSIRRSGQWRANRSRRSMDGRRLAVRVWICVRRWICSLMA